MNCFAANLAGSGSFPRINEQDQLRFAGLLGEFRTQLVSCDDLDFRPGQFSREFLGDVPAQTIVGPERIAVPDNENARNLQLGNVPAENVTD